MDKKAPFVSIEREEKTINPRSSVCSLDFSSDGEFLLSASSDYSIQLWNCIEHKQGNTSSASSRRVKAHSAKITGVKMIGRHLVSSSLDRSLRFWSTDRLLSSSSSSSSTLCDNSSFNPDALISSFFHSSAFSSIQKTDDPNLVLSGHLDSSIMLWDKRSPSSSPSSSSSESGSGSGGGNDHHSCQFRHRVRNAVETVSINQMNSQVMATFRHTGTISMFDMRNTSSELYSIEEGTVKINDGLHHRLPNSPVHFYSNECLLFPAIQEENGETAFLVFDCLSSSLSEVIQCHQERQLQPKRNSTLRNNCFLLSLPPSSSSPSVPDFSNFLWNAYSRRLLSLHDRSLSIFQQ